MQPRRIRSALLAAFLLPVAAGAMHTPASSAPGAACAPRAHVGGDWPMYGHDLANTRTQPMEKTIGITEAPLLSPVWSFSTADAGGNGDFTGTPVVADGCLYMASNRGWVFALNADTGALVWATKLRDDGGINSSVHVWGGRVFANVSRVGTPYVTSFDQRTGKQLWVTQVDKQAGSDVYGAPYVLDGMVFTGISGGSAELGDEADRYAFQGSFVLTDAKTGRIVKKTWVIRAPDEDRAKPKDDFAGAAVWATPAYDAKTKTAYVGGGNPFRPQAEHDYTNAILKIDLNRKSGKFGRIVASYKGNVDHYFPAVGDTPCVADIPGNPPPYYPQGLGECTDIDMDFGSSPNLFRDASGKLLVGEGQKSGVYHIADAATMAPVRTALVGPPSPVGGIVGSTAYDGTNVFGPIVPAGYLFSLDPQTATQRWVSPVGDGAHWGNPVAVANGVVYTTDLAGNLDAFDAATGAPLLHRPMLVGTGRADPMASWGGVAVARNTVYGSVGMTGLENGYVVAFRPGVGGGGVPGPPGGLPQLPANPSVVSGPQAQFYGYLTPVVPYSGGALSYTNADIVSHDVLQDVAADGVAGPDTQPWCKNFSKGKCPMFWTSLQALGGTTEVQGLANAKPGVTYHFYCSLHPGMKGTLAVLP